MAAVITVAAATVAVLAVSTFAGQSANKVVGVPPKSALSSARPWLRPGSFQSATRAIHPVRRRGQGAQAVVLRSDGVVITNQHVITNTRTNRSYDEIFLTLSGDGDSASVFCSLSTQAGAHK